MRSFGKTIPITIHPFFWLMAAAIGWLNSLSGMGTLLWVIVIFISVLVHELGHAVTALTFGQKVAIDLVALGGLTSRTGGQRVSLLQEFLIVFNGPLAGLFLFAFSWWMLGLVPASATLLIYSLTVSVYVNFFWTIVNLLPIQPLDGGKLLSIIMEGIMGLRGVKVALFISIALSGVLAMVSFAVGLLIPGVLFFIFAFESYRMWRQTLPMTEQDQDATLQTELQEAERDLEEGHIDEAVHLLEDVKGKGGSGVLSVAATELLAQTLASSEKYQEAYDLIAPMRKRLSPASLVLLHQLAYKLGHWREAADLGDYVYELMPSLEVALVNARSHARLGELVPARGWLQCAQSEGLTDVASVLASPDFDLVRKQMEQ